MEAIVASPFHEGELAVQARAGVAEQAAKVGARAIRDRLTEQHRAFFPLLPMLFLGAADAAGRPWASVVTGAPGFVTAPDERRLRVAARPAAGDALAGLIGPGLRIGVLGLEWGTRRRNRAAGAVAAAGADGFEIEVEQAFGNCPKYIQTREAAGVAGAPPSAAAAEVRAALDDRDRRLIRTADAFMIATAHPGGAGGPGDGREGADVSHRGGRPGFVEIEPDGALVWADYPGNRYFNTLGNIAANPRAGLLFLGWASRTVLQITGTAEILWDGPAVARLPGAERAVRVRPTEVRRIPDALAEPWRLLEISPYLERIGA